MIYGFTGRQFEPESGLYYYRNRSYDPMSGRFMTKDPKGISAGDVNLYRYVSNKPFEGVDPLGLYRFDPSEGASSVPEPAVLGGAGFNVSVVGGGELSAGGFSGKDFLGKDISGGFSSEGIGIGISAGADAFVGYTSDRNIDSTNVSFSIGVISVSIFLNPDGLTPIGGTIGPGAGFGASVTTTKTKFHCEN